MSPQLPTVTPELEGVVELRRVKLGRCLDTLPERLTLAHQQKLTHHEFLEMLLADEVTRRDTQSAILEARTAGLDPEMLVGAGRHGEDHLRPHDLERACSLRFVDAPNKDVRHPRPGRCRQDRSSRRCRTHRCQARGAACSLQRADTLLKF